MKNFNTKNKLHRLAILIYGGLAALMAVCTLFLAGYKNGEIVKSSLPLGEYLQFTFRNHEFALPLFIFFCLAIIFAVSLLFLKDYIVKSRK